MTQPTKTIEVADPIDLNMFEQLREQLSSKVDFAELAIAVVIIILGVVIGQFIARAAAKQLARFADGEGDDDIPLRYQPLLKATSRILRYAVAAIIFWAARVAWEWEILSQLLIGFSLALAVALSAYALLRALNLGSWMASLASLALFAFIFTESEGGVTSLTSLLQKASFSVGNYSFSLLTLVSAALIVIFLIALVRLGNRSVTMVLERNPNLDDGQRLLGEKLAMVAMVIGAFFIGIDMLGIDLTAFAVFSGAFGLAIGFGLQKTFGNLIAGIILLMDRSIKPGDVIAVGDTYGSVNKIGTRAVSIITRDGKEHLIPNENMMTNEVENWSFSSKNIRVRLPVGVSYLSDMELVQDLLRQSLEDHPRILKRPVPRVLMTGFGDNSVDFELRAWIRDPEEGVANFRSDIYNRIWALFKEHDIEIPYPQRDINFRNLPPGMKEAMGNSKAPPKKRVTKPKA